MGVKQREEINLRLDARASQPLTRRQSIYFLLFLNAHNELSYTQETEVILNRV
jgi:hypothetical protein